MGVRRRIAPLTRDQLVRLSQAGAVPEPSPIAGPDGHLSSRSSSIGNGASGPGPGTPDGTDQVETQDLTRPVLTSWAEHTLTEWGHCGMLAEHEGEIVGYLTLVPAARVPRQGPFATTSFGTDAAVVLGAYVVADWTRQGIGRQLIQAAAADLVGRRIAALEAVGRPTNSVVDLGGGLPEGWLTAVGFRLVRAHPLAPRYRMSLSSTLRWRPDLSAAWHRIAGLVPQAAPPEPARFGTHRWVERQSESRPGDHRRVPPEVG
ncbi:MAG: GNAT family N-acetyltransferase [Propionibacteriaceae bacterium]